VSAERATYSAWAVFCWRCQERHEPLKDLTDARGSDALFWFDPAEFAKNEGAPVCCPRCGTTEISARWVIQVSAP